MINFILGISIALNVLFIVGIIVYLNIKKNTNDLKNVISDMNSFKDFFK